MSEISFQQLKVAAQYRWLVAPVHELLLVDPCIAECDSALRSARRTGDQIPGRFSSRVGASRRWTSLPAPRIP